MIVSDVGRMTRGCQLFAAPDSDDRQLWRESLNVVLFLINEAARNK